MSVASELKNLNRRQALVHMAALAGLGAAWCAGLCDPALAQAAEDITLTAESPLLIDSGSGTTATYGTMTIEPGGYLAAVGTPVNLTVNTLVKAS